MVLWLDYLQNTGLPAKEAMFTKMHRAAERYTEKNHPLMQLDILEVDVDGNDAELALRKKGNREAPVIEIELTWVGSGWLIVNDNIFPDGGVLDRVMRTS